MAVRFVIKMRDKKMTTDMCYDVFAKNGCVVTRKGRIGNEQKGKSTGGLNRWKKSGDAV